MTAEERDRLALAIEALRIKAREYVYPHNEVHEEAIEEAARLVREWPVEGPTDVALVINGQGFSRAFLDDLIRFALASEDARLGKFATDLLRLSRHPATTPGPDTGCSPP